MKTDLVHGDEMSRVLVCPNRKSLPCFFGEASRELAEGLAEARAFAAIGGTKSSGRGGLATGATSPVMLFFHVQLFNACGIRDQSDPLVQARNLVDQAASAANLQHSLAALEAVAQKCVLTCSWLLLPTSILCSRCALTKVCVELHAVLTCVGWSAFVEANLKTVAHEDLDLISNRTSAFAKGRGIGWL